MVARTAVGKTVDVKVMRSGKTKMLRVEVGELSDEEVGVAAADDSEKLGLSVQELTPEIAESLGIEPGTKGIVVAAVEPGSVAEDAGLRRGDVILEVNRRPVEAVSEYRKALQKLEKGKSLLFLVRRGENTIFLALKPPSE